ncbi:MAG TPA: alginate lyase family protein [Verrucomicrobiae bacterium]|nr:alginate lyase family protein [Verrucomicrobiae bacterium]
MNGLWQAPPGKALEPATRTTSNFVSASGKRNGPACRFFDRPLGFSLVELLVVLAITLQVQGASNAQLARTVAQIDQARVFKLAGQALELKAPTITAYFATNSEGGPHDFYSQSDYFWPNPTNSNGLPYIGRDGETNPDNFDYHRMAMRDMKDAVAALAAAYALNGDQSYVAKAAELLRAFFLDEKTKMNPNLNYAQAVLGKWPGTSWGVIDTLHLAEVPVAVGFLEKASNFPLALDRGLKKWFADYLDWMTTSTNGVKEMNAANNHSIAYFVQAASFARFTGNAKLLNFSRNRFKEVLLPKQMAEDGSFPLELRRTKPYGYSIFQADNVATLCVLLSTPREDMWRLGLRDGRSPELAIDFIYPYLADKSKWVRDGRAKDVMHWDNWPMRQPCLLFAYAAFGDPKYFALWKRLDADPTDLEIRRNVAITQPLLWIAAPEDIPLLNRNHSEVIGGNRNQSEAKRPFHKPNLSATAHG